MALEWSNHELPPIAFREMDALILPDAFPRFLPTAWKSTGGDVHRQLDLSRLESIQIMILPPRARERVEAEIQSVLLSP